MIATLLLCTTTLAALPHDPPVASTNDKARVLVRCKTEALIRGTAVLMRDLATIETTSADLQSRIGDIRIANRPALGFNRVLPSGDIMRRLVANGLSPEQIEMTGAREVVAQPIATVLQPEDITAAADPVMRAVLEKQGSDIEFEILNKLNTLRVPPGRFDLALRAKLRNGRVNPTSATINLEIVVDEEIFKTIPLNYRLRHFANALTSARVIRKGESIDASNVMMQRVEVAPGTSSHLSSFELVDGMVAARDVQGNRLLRLGDVAKPAVVHRNDLVTLIAKRGRIQVSTKAVALQDGPVGGRIMVRSLSTTKPVQAIVYSSGIVVIPN